VVPLNGLLRNPQLLLHDLGLYPQIRELVAKSLSLYPQRLALLLANLDLLLQQGRPFNGNIVFGFQIL
jgi:hypothetical protein